MEDNIAPLSINLMIFLISAFLGLGLIQKVSRLLHTPLMSLTNAISSVSMIAALIVMAHPRSQLITVMVTVAVALAAVNVVSGFMITERILRMFKGNGGKRQ